MARVWQNTLLCLCVVLQVYSVFGFHSGYFPSLTEVDSANIKHNLHGRVKRSDEQSKLPEEPREIHTRLLTTRHDVTLKFKPIIGLRMPPLIYMDVDGEIGEHLSRKQNCTMFYEDLMFGAHAIIDMCDSADQVSMMAELYLEDGHHVILPKEKSPDSGGVTHSLYAVNTSISFLHDYVLDPDLVESAKSEEVKRSRTKRMATGSYLIEMMAVIDYSMYDFWYKFSPSTDSNSARETKTMDLIQAYYTFIARSMNFRYRKASAQNLNIGVELNQIYVLQTMASSNMTVPVGHVSGVRDIVDADTVLSNFISWIADKKANEQGFFNEDTYVLFTNQDIAKAGVSAVVGFASLGQICTADSVSVVEGQFDFITSVIASHEVGHSLGGSHDGDGNTCSSSLGFVLATENSIKEGAFKNNPFMFSTCSITSFKTLIQGLDANNNNCLLVNNVPTVQTTNQAAPGQQFSVDRQCELIYGQNVDMWRLNNIQNDLTYNDICTGMTCRIGSSGQLILPAAGTSCGSGKWCQNGECVTSDSAPASDSEACLFGDQPGFITGTSTCNSVFTPPNPGVFLTLCYKKATYVQCCATCESLKLDIPNCPYGDRSNCTLINDLQCYDPDVETNSCCQTCHQVKQKYANLQNCPYGNRVSNCAPQHCANHQDDCCALCADTTTAAPTGVSTEETQPTQPTQAPTTEASTGDDLPGVSTEETQPTQPTQAPTTEASTSEDLPDWVIPVAAGIGGLFGLILIIALVYYLCIRNRSGNDKRERRGRRDRRDRRDRHRSRDRHREERNHFDNRHRYPDNFGRHGHGGYSRY